MIITFISRLLLVGLLALLGYLAYKGYLTDINKLKNLVKGSGVFGPVLFFVMQIIQVAIPIFPGGISTIAGVALFGPFLGFLLNYTGICIGSLLGFHIAKRFGRPSLALFFKPETIAKYEKWTDPSSNFTKYFAIAIFLPFAPDDFLCYLAGTTKMSYQTFTTIILLGKPLAIIVYSMGLFEVLQQLFWT
ncbi:TVP38/TMEM64 family protein [Streptococcus rifensis]